MPALTVAVEPGPRRLDALSAAAGEDAVLAVRAAATALEGLRVVHLTTPPFAPAALDALRSMVPLLRDGGLDVRWLAVAGDDRADAAARAAGDALRGGEPGAPGELDAWLERGAQVHAELPRGTDVVVAHGVEALAALGGARGAQAPRAVWWIDGDLSAPWAEAWERVAPLAAGVVVVGDPGAAPPPGVRAEPIAPALDPLVTRNLDLGPRLAGPLARAAGIDLGHPFLVQVVDVDGWSRPELALEALRAARRAGAEDLQLVIAARLPAGDARAWRTLGELSDHIDGTDGVRVLANVGGAADAELNALQRLARVALAAQPGPGVLEALWKGTPVLVAAEPGGLGEHVASPEERGRRAAELVADPGLAAELGRAGRDRVRTGHLVTRLLRDELALLARVAGS